MVLPITIIYLLMGITIVKSFDFDFSSSMTGVHIEDLTLTQVYAFPPMEDFVDPQHFRCGYEKNESNSCCSCKPSCVEEQTCCVDYFWYERPFWFNMDEYWEFFMNKTAEVTVKPCQKLLKIGEEKNDTIYEGEAFHMISACKKNSSEIEKQMCRNGGIGFEKNFQLPVLDNDNQLYKNQYCAQCNSIQEMQLLDLKMSCTKKTKNDYCRLFISDTIHQGCLNFNTACEPDHRFYKLCQLFQNPIVGYKNYFCLLCENENNNNIFNNRTPFFQDTCQRDDSLTPFSWSYYLRFMNQEQSLSDCDKGDIAGIISGSCQFIRCPDGYISDGTKCLLSGEFYHLKEEKREVLSDANFLSCFESQKVRYLSIHDTNPYQILRELLYLNQSVIKNTYRYFNKTTLIRYLPLEKVELDAILLFQHFLFTGKIILSLTKPDIVYSHDLDLSHAFPLDRYCFKPKLINQSVVFTNKCEVKHGDKTIKNSELSMLIELENGSPKYSLYSCELFYMKHNSTCHLVRLSSNSTERQNDGSLTYTSKEGQENNFPLQKYGLADDGDYVVCVERQEELSPLPSWYKDIATVESNISCIGSTLSFVCYIMILYTYIRFKALRNRSTYYCLNLCLSLLVSDGMFLTINYLIILNINYSEEICQVFGAMSHFFLLCAQAWSLVMAIDVFRIIRSKRAPSNIQDNQIFKLNKSHIFVLVTSAVITIISLLCEHFHIIDMNYAKNGICALHGFYARLLFLILPLSMSIIISIILLVWCLIYIWREKHRSREMIKDGHGVTEINLSKIALKLIIIFGLPEILGFVQFKITRADDPMWIYSSVFSLTYSLVRSCRGLMLFVVQLCRGPVIQVYRIQLLRVFDKRRVGKVSVNDNDNRSSYIE